MSGRRSQGLRRQPMAPSTESLPQAPAAASPAELGADCLKYLDTLFREYLLFRGLSSTLQAFNHELATEPTSGFRASAVCDLIFSKLIPGGDLRGLLDLMDFLKARFYSRLDIQHEATIREMETALLRRYVVAQWQAGRKDLVAGFFTTVGERLLRAPESDSWHSWFALSCLPSVAEEPHMQAFFRREWAEAAELSFRNFLSRVFAMMPLPAVLRFNVQRQQRKELQSQVELLTEENAALRCSLAKADAAAEEAERRSRDFLAQRAKTAILEEEAAVSIHQPHGSQEAATESPLARDLGSEAARNDHRTVVTSSELYFRTADTTQEAKDQARSSHNELGRIASEETSVPDGPEIVTLNGSQSCSTTCRFSPGGELVASGAIDGTVRIWAPECLGGGAESKRRAATFQAGGAILSLDWDRRANKVMLVGTSLAGVKAWHLDTCRIVGTVRPEALTEPMSHVLSVAASPTEAVFAASMATSAAVGCSSATGRLTLWNLRTFLKAATLTLDALDPSEGRSQENTAVTSLDFSQDGRLLGAACSDGSVRIFDIAAGRGQAFGWVLEPGPSGTVPCTSLRFSSDNRSILTLTEGGTFQEWDLALTSGLDTARRRRRLVASCSASGGAPLSPRDVRIRRHFALSPACTSAVLTSCSSVGGGLPLARKEGSSWDVSSMPMSSQSLVHSVDWHPEMPVAAAGLDDGSVSLYRA